MNQIITEFLQDKIDECSSYAKTLKDAYDYYCWDKDFRQQLITCLKQRSEYKRILKEYEKLCREVEVQKYQKAIKEYKKHPDKWVENMLGCKLMWYQKLVLRMNWR